MTSSKADRHCSNECTIGSPEGPSWGQIVVEKLYAVTKS